MVLSRHSVFPSCLVDGHWWLFLDIDAFGQAILNDTISGCPIFRCWHITQTYHPCPLSQTSSKSRLPLWIRIPGMTSYFFSAPSSIKNTSSSEHWHLCPYCFSFHNMCIGCTWGFPCFAGRLGSGNPPCGSRLEPPHNLSLGTVGYTLDPSMFLYCFGGLLGTFDNLWSLIRDDNYFASPTNWMLWS